jgi:catalase
MADSNKHATGSTMSTGDPAPSDRNSLSIGSHGPILLHDVHFSGADGAFHRERFPSA